MSVEQHTPREPEPLRCTFCGKAKSEVRAMVQDEHKRVRICEECIEESVRLIGEVLGPWL